jgi:hypothetical protein
VKKPQPDEPATRAHPSSADARGRPAAPRFAAAPGVRTAGTREPRPSRRHAPPRLARPGARPAAVGSAPHDVRKGAVRLST